MKKSVVIQKTGTISLLMIITSIMIASAFSFYDYIRERSRLREDFDEIIAPVSSRLASNLQAPIWFTNKNQAEQIIAAEMTNKRIYAVIVKDADQTLFTGKKRDEEWKIIESEGNISGSFVIREDKIFYEGEPDPIGTVNVYFSTCFMEESLRRLVIFMAVRVVVMSVFLVSVLLGIVNFFFIKPVSEIITTLNVVGNEVGAASERLMAVGRQLAGGASRQTAAVEETSSSLDEITEAIRENMENITHANRLMIQTSQVVINAENSMTHLTDSINEITQTSEETRKVIKSIEDIAFQINLLAMNASVEAARAGDAGLGFAVVAQEVRNLALRSKQAAENTTALIESSVQKTGKGTEMVYKTGEAFASVSAGAKKVGELLSKVAGFSQDQEQGISYISKAMKDINRVTQENTSGAEEAAKEIGLQAERMKTIVTELVTLIGRKGKKRIKDG